jgi:hypothetical protein
MNGEQTWPYQEEMEGQTLETLESTSTRWLPDALKIKKKTLTI